jgi:hypothetical protein
MLWGHRAHRDEPVDRCISIVGMDGRHRSRMSCVEGLDHVERLVPSHLSDHQSVWPEPESVAHKGAYGDLARSLDIRRVSFEPDHVAG